MTHAIADFRTVRARLKVVFSFACIPLFLFLAGCSGQKDVPYAGVYEAQADAAVSEMYMQEPAASYEGSGAGQDVSAPYTAQGRKLIMYGDLNIEVENLAGAEKSVAVWCASLGGYIQSSHATRSSYSVTARVPSERFAQAMESAGSLGTVTGRSISSEDVSERYYDLETRLAARKILRDRLQTYLAQANDMKEMLAVEQELNSVISDIESMEGQFRRLSEQVNYATVNINMSLPYRATDSGFQWPSLGADFRRLAANTVDFFASFLIVLLYIVIYGVPIVLALALFYWLLFGRIGLLRRLFSRLRANRPPRKERGRKAADTQRS